MSLFSRIRSVGVVILIIAVIAAVVGKMFASSMPASITISAQSWRNTSFNVATTVRCCDIERRHISTLSREEWQKEYAAIRRPVILTGAMDNWPAMKQWDSTFFSRAPWASHKVRLTQQSLMDICVTQSQLREAIAARHPHAQLRDSGDLSPGCVAFFKGRETMKAELGRLFQAGQMTIEELTQDVIDARIRDTVLPALLPAPYRSLDSTLGYFAAKFGENATDDSWSTYLFLEKKLFDDFPELWSHFVSPVPDILDPVDFTPPAMKSRKSLLMGREGSRSSLHQDPFGYTSWIGIVSGAKAFRLWPADDADPFYPLEGYSSGVRKSVLDSFNVVPNEAVDFHKASPVEVVLRPGEILVTQDWWHQALNIEDTIAVTGNFIDSGNVRNVLRRAVEANLKEIYDSVLLLVKERDHRLYGKLGPWLDTLKWP